MQKWRVIFLFFKGGLTDVKMESSFLILRDTIDGKIEIYFF